MQKHDNDPDNSFMRRAFELAVNGLGNVAPNPLVGSVIVHDGMIIGEGAHRRYGEAHAEVNAVNSVNNKSLLSESTVYVNLEPCSHYGKTPPCADMLIANQVKRVVISNVDSNPLVSGRGIQKLLHAGIDVTQGILEKEGRQLNKRFFTMVEKKRPYIVLKWAQTSDGFMARENYDSKWISNIYSRQLTHKWRTEEDAILVGTRTAALDNPQLTVRYWTGKNPIRIVIDRKLMLDRSLHVFDEQSKTLRYNILRNEESGNVSTIRLNDTSFLSELLNDLYIRKIQSVFVEGGPTTLNSFIALGLWDEARIFQSSERFGKGISAPALGGTSIETVLFNDKLIVVHPTDLQ